MFRNRFGMKWSWEGPERLKNIYFVYILELRALIKATPYLRKELFYTGNSEVYFLSWEMIFLFFKSFF